MKLLLYINVKTQLWINYIFMVYIIGLIFKSQINWMGVYAISCDSFSVDVPFSKSPYDCVKLQSILMSLIEWEVHSG
jgi:hypothetical protein